MMKLKIKYIGILYDGGHDGFSINTGLTRNNQSIERKRRAGFAYLLATNPETFEAFTKNNVNLFHGTSVNALPNILKYGMQSVDGLENKGIEAATGEEWSRIGGKRNFISFTDDLDTALDYASVYQTENNENLESFGMLIGMSSEKLEKLQTCRISSDVPEIGIMDNIPLDCISTIAVPENKVEYVKKLVNNEQISVVPIAIDERFYYMDTSFNEISIDYEKANQLSNKTQNKTNFNSQQLNKLSTKRKNLGIKNIFQSLKGAMKNRGRDNGEYSRNE